MTRQEILKEVEKIICMDKEKQYGSPEDNFKQIGYFWADYLTDKCIGGDVDVCIEPQDVAVMMILLKIAMIKTGEPNLDNYIDIAGYAACAGELVSRALD